MQPRIRYKDREGIFLKERITQSKTPQTIKSARFPETILHALQTHGSSGSAKPWSIQGRI